MKTLLPICLIFCIIQLSAQPDYTFTYSRNDPNNEWMGSYSEFGSSQPFDQNYLSIGRLNSFDMPVDRSGTSYGDGDPGTTFCGIVFDAADGSNSDEFGTGASLPDNKSILVSNNHPTETVYIKYWDDGDGTLSTSGYPFSCSGIGIPDYILPPGESVTLLRTGDVIAPQAAPIPTLSQWGIIALSMLLLIFGLIGLKQRKLILG